MPPAVFVDKAVGVDTAGDLITFTLPATVRAGDVLLALVAGDPTQTGPTADSLLEWSLLTTLAVGPAIVYVLRRTATDDEGVSTAIAFNGAWLMGVLMDYRGVDAAAAAIGSAIANIAASTNFACPSETLARYSDLYLGIAVVTSAATGVTPPAGTIERHEQQAGGRTLEVFELLAEAPGATGTKTATTGANQSGVAASIALAALPTLHGLDYPIVLDPPGTIGLPMEGV